MILPNLVAAYPERYAAMGLRDLSDEMFDHYKRSNQMHHLQAGFLQPAGSRDDSGRCVSASGAQPSGARPAG